MTDAAIRSEPAPGRSLWDDAWLRLKRNKAAVVSAVYLVLMALACLVGPTLTGHEYTTIYRDYVRMPPSPSAYPQGEVVAEALDEVIRRARVELLGTREEGGRLHIDIASDAPIDERVVRYFDRASTFEDSRVEATGRRRAGDDDLGRRSSAPTSSSAPTIRGATC